MCNRAAWLLCLLLVVPATARDKAEAWLAVRSLHFTIVTNAGEKMGRRIADQFERMRSVFQVQFPHLSLDNGSPITVLAIRDEKDFRTLEPQSFLAKGQLKLGGLFLRAPDKNYVLMRVDAEGEHPYAVIYHEYTHYLLSSDVEWLPLWLNEGMAEFFQNTEIHEKDVALGQPSPKNLQLLREGRLLPLATLFAVDATSPYYHEENKGSIFYAESWALTHYLYTRDYQEKRRLIPDYAELLAKKVDSVTAATRAFGDLKQLQYNLEAYIRQGSFAYFKLSTPASVDDSTFKVQAMAAAQADAVRADFLAYEDRFADARSLLQQVLRDDPQNVLAHETMGLLEFRAGHIEEARKWYETAVKLDSQSYLSHYYYAAMSMNAGTGDDDPRVESSLRAAIRLNPSFAPAFDALAAFEGERRRNLDEAYKMAMIAIKLDPQNVGYRIDGANVLMQMDRADDAIDLLHRAAKLAKSPEETARLESVLENAEEFAIARQSERVLEDVTTNAETTARFPAQDTVSASVDDEVVPVGPHHFLSGTLQSIQCHDLSIDLTVDVRGKKTALHNGNLYKIGFTTFGFSAHGDLNPCKDLEGRVAKVEYVESSAKSVAPYIVAIELHR